MGEVVDVDRPPPGAARRRRHGAAVRLPGARHRRDPRLLRPRRVGEHAPGLKTTDDAVEIRRRFLLAFEAAEREATRRPPRLLTFVDRRRRPHRRGAGRRHGRDRAHGHAHGLPFHRHDIHAHHPGGRAGPGAAQLPTGAVGEGAAPAGAAGRGGPHRHPGHGHGRRVRADGRGAGGCGERVLGGWRGGIETWRVIGRRDGQGRARGGGAGPVGAGASRGLCGRRPRGGHPQRGARRCRAWPRARCRAARMRRSRSCGT
jgi:hypothetical protein